MPYVLIIDDEPDAGEIVETYLQKSGYKTRVVPNGREALAALLVQSPDALVLDVRMPEMDGIALLEVLRSYLRWHTLPVVIVTAHANQRQLERARELGVEHIFHKAKFKLSELAGCLQEIAPSGVGKNN
jgi:CheY-like chemotaxis protein